MKYAISTLRLELSALKSHMNLVASTELKMEYAGRIDAIEKAIKHLRQVNQKCHYRCEYATDTSNEKKFCEYCGREIKEKIGK